METVTYSTIPARMMKTLYRTQYCSIKKKKKQGIYLYSRELNSQSLASLISEFCSVRFLTTASAHLLYLTARSPLIGNSARTTFFLNRHMYQRGERREYPPQSAWKRVYTQAINAKGNLRLKFARPRESEPAASCYTRTR